MSTRSRFTPAAADALRQAIREAGGVEVFAIGEVDGGVVQTITVTCRGTVDRVPALLDRPRPGQVVIHNHPSGDLRPSDPDLHLAGIYGDDGVGVVIVDSLVERSNWVVEPHVEARVRVDASEVEAFFREALPRALGGAEVREPQIELALETAAALSDGGVLVAEAGTGTGKSLAYLVPAALWARANRGRVVISTYTRALQAQLLTSDIPLLRRAGLDVTAAVLQGRGNYICKRRLAAAAMEDDALPTEDRSGIARLAAWESEARDGSRAELPGAIDPDVWDRVASDSDLTLRARCPHYAVCRYYVARRRAAAADLVVVNHALLLADLRLKEVDAAILPKFDRVIVDEGHHLQDAATGALAESLTGTAVRRAVLPLLDRRRGRLGALSRVVQGKASAALPPDRRAQLAERAAAAAMAADASANEVPGVLTVLDAEALDDAGSPLRITAAREDGPAWRQVIAPQVAHAALAIETAHRAIETMLRLFDDVVLDEEATVPLLDVRRAARRLAGQAATARRFLEHDEDQCRWLERARRGGRTAGAALRVAPIDVGPLLQRTLWEPMETAVVTSATLTVNRHFGYWGRAVGVRTDHARTLIFPSPFDHREQALLALPRDLPVPDAPQWAERSAAAVVDAVRASGGGAFVLCTSYRAVRRYAEVLRRALPGLAVLEQGGGSRALMLQRFRADRHAVLVGTDSFWEGVSVRGDALRLVIIPRLPFRVPTEPVLEARQERITRRGGDPFRADALPHAVLRLRQGYGRLIRSRDDRGAVLVLDRRLHDRSYGALMLRSLPPARRATGPWRAVLPALQALYASGGRSG